MEGINAALNPFLAVLVSQYRPLLHQAAKDKLIVCLPQGASLLDNIVTENDIKTHLLHSSRDDGVFSTLNNKTVDILGNKIRTREGFNTSRTCKILLHETLPWLQDDTEQETMITILHLNRPLVGGVPVHVPDDASAIDHCTLMRFLAMIRAYPESELPLKKLDSFISRLQDQLKNSSNGLNHVLQQIREQWGACSFELAASGTFREVKSSHLQVQLEQVVESYLMESLQSPLFRLIRHVTAEQEEEWIKTMYSYRYYTQSDLGISKAMQCEQLKAISLLQSIVQCKTPLEMLLRLKDTTESISAEIQATLKDSYQLTTDDLLDQLLYVILKCSQIPLIAILKYISEFHFVNSNTSILGFTFANFQVAVDWYCLRTKTTAPRASSIIESTNMLNVPSTRRLDTPSYNFADDQDSRSVHLLGCECQTIDDAVWDHDRVTVIRSGRRFFAAVTESGALYTWGIAQGGRLGHAHSIENPTLKDSVLPMRVLSLERQHVIQIACGAFHMLATDVNGHLWTWGSGQDGQLGLGSIEQCTKPVQSLSLCGRYISSVAAGTRHSIALTSRGQIFTWGLFQNGRLGRDASQDPRIPALVSIDWSGRTLDGSRRPDPLDLEMDEEGAVLRVACGDNHSLAVTRDGAVFAWGNGSSGQLGLGSFSDVSFPQQVFALSNPAIEILQVAAGSVHSAFLTKTGFVLTCGTNSIGQLGILEMDDTSVPRVVSSLTSHHMIQISCGETHTVALTSNGITFAWGNNLQHQCNPTQSSSLTVPTAIHQYTRIHQISAGAAHTLLIGQADVN